MKKTRVQKIIDFIVVKSKSKLIKDRYVSYEDLQRIVWHPKQLMPEVKKRIELHELETEKMTNSGTYKEFALRSAVFR